MGKKAILFPGQGAQKVGMGKDLYDACPQAREVFERANAAIGFDLAKLCFEGPEAELNDTAVSQPAILVASIAALEALKAKRGADAVRADMTAGLSLGEYTALVFAGAIAFEDAVRLVRQRGLFMKQAGEQNPGTMLSVLGMSREDVLAVVEASKGAGIVVAANFNSPGQIVLSGSVEGITAAEAAAKAKGCKRAIRLTVSGAFHSPLMAPAADKLRAELERTTISEPRIPVVTNVTGKFIGSAASARNILIGQMETPVQLHDLKQCIAAWGMAEAIAAEVRDLLARQLTSAVLWEDSMQFMAAQGVTEAVEVGPGKVLSGLMAKIDKNVSVTNVGTLADLA